MKVKFYTSLADDRRVDKTNYLKNEVEIDDVIFKETEEKEKPIIILQMSNPVAKDFSNDKNYVYIEELKSYYFIRGVNFLSGKREAYQLEQDDLMTNRNEILNLVCVIQRQENRYDRYIPDDAFIEKAYTTQEVKSFSSGFDTSNDSFVLAISGRS